MSGRPISSQGVTEFGKYFIELIERQGDTLTSTAEHLKWSTSNLIDILRKPAITAPRKKKIEELIKPIAWTIENLEDCLVKV